MSPSCRPTASVADWPCPTSINKRNAAVANRPKRNASHGAHCTNPDCVQYWLNEGAARFMEVRYDETHGGFDSAPKFPQAMALDFLLRLPPEGEAGHRRASRILRDVAHEALLSKALGRFQATAALERPAELLPVVDAVQRKQVHVVEPQILH